MTEGHPIHSPDRHRPRHPELVSGSITSATRLQRIKAQIARQIPPLRVRFFNQVDLPLSAPVLDLFFAGDRLVHGANHFEMDQQANVVALGKTIKRSIPVLRNPSHQVRLHTGVNSLAKTARHDVSARFDDALHSVQFAVRWTLKQVQGNDWTEH